MVYRKCKRKAHREDFGRSERGSRAFVIPVKEPSFSKKRERRSDRTEQVYNDRLVIELDATDGEGVDGSAPVAAPLLLVLLLGEALSSGDN